MSNTNRKSFILWVRRGFVAFFRESIFSFFLQVLWITLMPIHCKKGIFSLSCLSIQVGFLLWAFWMSFRARGAELEVVGHTLHPCNGGIGKILPCKIKKVTKRTLGNRQLFLNS
jgi:hypothetical protein